MFDEKVKFYLRKGWKGSRERVGIKHKREELNSLEYSDFE